MPSRPDLPIRWQSAALPASPRECGHGVAILYHSPADPTPRFAAWIDGFAWHHAGAPAVVTCDPARFPSAPAEAADLRTAVEAALRRGEIVGELRPGLTLAPNA